MTATRRVGGIAGISLSLDKIDKLQSGTPNGADLIAFFSEDDGYAFSATISNFLSNSGSYTAAAGTNNLTTAQNGQIFHNNGAVALVTLNLPAAVNGLKYSAVVLDTDGIKIQANTGDVITSAALGTGATSGYIQSAVIGSTLSLICIVDGTWIISAMQGDWSLDS